MTFSYPSTTSVTPTSSFFDPSDESLRFTVLTGDRDLTWIPSRFTSLRHRGVRVTSGNPRINHRKGVGGICKFDRIPRWTSSPSPCRVWNRLGSSKVTSHVDVVLSWHSVGRGVWGLESESPTSKTRDGPVFCRPNGNDVLTPRRLATQRSDQPGRILTDRPVRLSYHRCRVEGGGDEGMVDSKTDHRIFVKSGRSCRSRVGGPRPLV